MKSKTLHNIQNYVNTTNQLYEFTAVLGWTESFPLFLATTGDGIFYTTIKQANVNFSTATPRVYTEQSEAFDYFRYRDLTVLINMMDEEKCN
jgi:hypothetical protein